MTDDRDAHNVTSEHADRDGRAKRMAVRFTDEDLAFLAEHADDEGVEPATLVRMIVARLRKGRQPLISMMEQAAPAPRAVRSPMPHQVPATYQAHVQPTADDGMADDVLNQRLAELDGADVVQLHQPEDEVAAVPLRRVERNRFNPGRN